MWHVGSGQEPAYHTDEVCSPWQSPWKECFPRKNPTISRGAGGTRLTFVSQSGSAGTAAYSRLYHPVALLLPDATVMSAGSNPKPRGRYAPTIEIYTPAYLFDAND